ncbi:GerAB/ArcD/ProY family transporter [Priestia filamentosa]|uniref:GerAB/ArcD/ProY family transporter n=1 Tax=Priestia filamentosa TaxID=1402861 RepID=UPI001FB5661F|nr:GerAB/ArcD/ProY family transporter [Priestia filamentosa]MED3727700.1 GerAB/ArcD/ProY family transporter [Priestia filamentosa]UOE62753.1 GerAB/ArcD/ProY family transporter [Priestia filamentosa]
MEKAKISVIQLFALMFIFEMGTAVVTSYGINAKKDVWLAILLGMFVGVVFFFVYYFLFRQYPNLPLTGHTRKIFGKYLGWIIGLLYVLYFLYNAADNIRSFGDLLLSSILPQTPLLAIIILFVLTMCYVLYLGIEVVGRTAEVFIVILILFGITGNFLALISGDIDLDKVRPFLENGWTPILTTALLETSNFPFNQLIVFMTLLPYLNRPRLIKKVWLSALISGGLILSWTASLNIAIIGVEEVKKSTFPLLLTVGKINLLEFIQRLDVIVVFTLLITVFFKASIFFYGALIGIVDLFKLKNHQQIILPIAFIIIFLSMAMASSYSEHTEEGIYFNRYIIIYFHVIIPLLMLLVTLIRNRFKKKSRLKKSNGT